MVISVDTGNKMIKTEHYEFNSGIDVLDTIPGENDEVIEFGGKYYRTTNRRIYFCWLWKYITFVPAFCWKDNLN